MVSLSINQPNQMYRIIINFLLLLFLFFGSKAQDHQSKSYLVQQLDNKDGLSNSCINYIFQDSHDLLWLATWDGLNVYDGSGFSIFNYSKENISKSIGNNVILQIVEDRSGFIWIGTVEGISRYDKRSGKFYNYFYDRGGKNKIGEQEFILAINNKGELYASAKKYGKNIYRYDQRQDKFVVYDIPIKHTAVKMLFDAKDRLWILNTNRQLEVYSREKNSYMLNEVYGNTAYEKGINEIFYTNHKLFYQAEDRTLHEIDGKLQQTEITTLPNVVLAVAFYKGHYVFSKASSGYEIYDTNFKPSSFLENELHALQSMQITALKHGNDQSLWIGTDGDGILRVSERQNFFGSVKSLPGNFKFDKAVRAFSEVDKDLWVGTKGNGIMVIPDFLKNRSLRQIKNLKAPGVLDNNSVFAFERDNAGLVYIGTNGTGVTIYDTQQRRFIKWSAIKGHEKYPEFRSVYAILKDDDGSVWMGTNWFGLIHLKISRNHKNELEIVDFKQYHFNGSETGPGNDIIYTLAAGNNDRLWVGCRYGGLSLFDKKAGKFRTFKAFTYNGSLSNNDVLSLYKDRQDRLWIGTSYGLNWMNEADALIKEPQFKKLTTEDGLPNNTIHAISQESSGDIWISTNRGLAKLNPGNLEILRFGTSDGLQSNEFSDGAVWKSPGGYLFFGGIHGFNYFLPSNIRLKQLPNNLLITNLKLAGSPINEKSLQVIEANANYQPKKFELGRNDNFFELVLKGINYTAAEKGQYAYLLEGNDKEWRYTAEDGKIAYTNIPPGKYKLKVKWSNGEGLWSNQVVVMDFEVAQYFWFTFPAFLLYVLLISGGVYLFYRYRRNKMAMDHKLSMEHMLRLKDEEVYLEQQHFFTNITHELQTPLTLILGALERMKRPYKQHEDPSEFVNMVHQQAARLAYLVNQLLEFRRVEGGFHKNYYSFLDVSTLLSNIAGLFSHMVESKDLTYEIDIQKGMEMWVDKDKLEKIIFNLLSNAFKHSGQHQHIRFSLKGDGYLDKLEVCISNSGVDLKEEELEQLFDRFFVKDDVKFNKVSSGIGLAFTSQLVKLLDGEITASCEKGWISFKLQLPLSFVPGEEQIMPDPGVTLDVPSEMLKSVAGKETSPRVVSIEENNKQALVASFEQEGIKSILIVEDEPNIRYLLKDILADTYILYEAGNGEEALGLLKNIIPNLIISDVMMPDMDGLELCKIIKNTPDTCHVPFIMLTARNTEEQKVDGYDSGADAYISKPFNIDHLLVRVRKLIEYRQKLDQFFDSDNGKMPLAAVGLKDADKQLIGKIIQIVEEHMENIELDASFLEEKLSLSKMQLYRKLKSLSNMTPNELIKNIRLQRAAFLLQSSDLTVSEIFYQTGFNHQSYFYREFKKRYNYSPNDYRMRRRIVLN